ncbi:uncharacterized protein LOC131936280 [Physella acuta]|uniref:uncharacterized protein LOC131936280 n=1 Tax=Physella acuta TaxID=109671 RepID=UPI0027DB0A9A|nr:uncharacterized protein LOC131936280 [Physella acuta]
MARLFLYVLVLLALSRSLHAAAVKLENPCASDPCTEGHHCQTVENSTAPYVCLRDGYRFGDCSLNAYLSCDQYAKCLDSEADHSFTCQCPENAVEGDGFKVEQGGTGCKLEYKPCAIDNDCPEHGFCNKEYKCECKKGFQGNGHTCTDIDECLNSPCDPHANCTNSPGSFVCFCDAYKGFRGDGFKCQFACGSHNDCDAPRAVCNEQDLCECIKGYQGDGLNCTDADECATPGAHNCSEKTNCINVVGSFKCECKNGYTGNGINCTNLPQSCKEIPRFTNGNKYKIDPDFTGPADAFMVICDKINGVVVTKLPAIGPFPLSAPEATGPLVIEYEPKPSDLASLLENSGFCYQDFSFSCFQGFSMFPGTKWYDAYGEEHKNWGSTKDEKCACGELKRCPLSCYCDGTQRTIATDYGRVMDKSRLPVMKLNFDQTTRNKGNVDIQPVVCSDVPVGIPKDCHEAKFTYKIKKNTIMYIDIDGPGGQEPFLVYCDMESFSHVGITEISTEVPTISPNTTQGTPVSYTLDHTKIDALISGSLFCSQEVRFVCKNSKLTAGGGYVSVTSAERKLEYFPGANGVQNSCGCGTTHSCAEPEVKCNCDIGDDVERTDFGLIIDKADLPVVRVTAEFGSHRNGTYSVGNLRCSQIQFGIEPNCEKYRQAGINKDHTYLVDPDGPGKQPPFNVECNFIANPPQGVTIVHHDNEKPYLVNASNWLLHYLQVNHDQLEALKNRSTFCTQEISIGCKKVSIQLPGTINWLGAALESLELPQYLESCGYQGQYCNCNGQEDSSDRGVITDKDELPIKALDFSSILHQLTSSKELQMFVGPMSCSEVFPTCALLQDFLNSNRTSLGENYLVSGMVTIDPDGPGGVEPFGVSCSFSKTTVTVIQNNGNLMSSPNHDPVDKCFDISYSDQNGNPISAAQISALVKRSNKCRQDLSLECQHAPATNHVNYTSCDGTPQKGWAGSYKQDKCACGVNGNCVGGPTARCNCDMNDGVVRTDAGSIINTDSLPVCQVCFSIEPKPGTADSPGPLSYLKYTLGELTCDGGQGTQKTCQAARQSSGSNIKSSSEGPVASSLGVPIPFGCKFYPNPPIGVLAVKAEDPLFPPTMDSTTVVNITYVTINITMIRDVMQKNEYCTQNVFLFCASPESLQLGGKYGWYNFREELSYEWVELAETSDEITQVANTYKDLVSQCGLPKGFKVTQKESLPIARLVLAGSGVTVVIGDAECLDLKTSCQEILDTNSRTTGLVSGKTFVIDPDRSGPIKPFKSWCEFDDTNKNGVTEIPIIGNWSSVVHVTDKEEVGVFELPIQYDGATHEQVDALTEISNFCWQGVSFQCSKSPVMTPLGAATLNFPNNKKSAGFATGSNTSFPGCACALTGTCRKGYVCNCDAMRPAAIDQGAVSDPHLLPITSVSVGGQIPQISYADIGVTNIRCSSKPIDPPRDCADAFKKKSQYGISYSFSSEYLISPDPERVKPFMVRCDFELQAGVGVTVIEANASNQRPLNPDPEHPNEIFYYAPSEEQLQALITQSAYCYQAVRFDCFASTFLSEGTYWLTLGSREKRHFWGGGEPTTDGRGGLCACGKQQSCGGLDSKNGQLTRRCNCDAGDEKKRSDAGIIDIKEFLPVSKLFVGRLSKFQAANITIGKLYCSQEPLKFNECSLGFFDCHEKADCLDDEVGYRCACKPGWTGKGVEMTSSDPRANGRECIDDDECVASHPCPYSATCTNTPGDFYCTCKPGYKQTGKTTCEDINECASADLNECHADARCENLDGGYRCICNKGYRGDGFKCVPVGECACFGDPHCISYDHRWLHFQGDCEYVMSQDGCEAGQEPTFRVLVENWKRNNKLPGHYSWIKAVIVQIFDKVIRLEQNNVILVNGIAVKQYFDQHKLSVITFNNRVKLQTVIGLEVVWDGKDSIEITVPQNTSNDVCGLCGNYNGDPEDDWTQGPACPQNTGKVTDNPFLFGTSWTSVTSPEKTCDVSCENQQPPSDPCLYPQVIVEKECSKIINLVSSPFKSCLLLKKPSDIEEFMKSCVFDICHAEVNFEEDLCNFAQFLSVDCADNEKVEIKNWQKDVQVCGKPDCPNNLIHKECGPVHPETCLSRSVNSSLTLVPDAEACTEGCYCPDGLILEGNKCITREQCGCLYNNGYLATGDSVYLPDCSNIVTCTGTNVTTHQPVVCPENQECRTENGVTGCYCVEGFINKNGQDICERDVCADVVCKIANMECVNGTCVCKQGYIGDCNQCEDIDECATGGHNCSLFGQQCINLDGSFTCGCKPGYFSNGGLCTDIDECEYGIHNCGDHAECVNNLGGFSCECCAGYKKNSRGACVRDSSESVAPNGKCCACQGLRCPDPGQVCGTDGKTYSSYRSLSIAACKSGDESLKLDYKGPCQGTCAAVQCEKQYSNCSMVNGVPHCACPTCTDVSSTYQDITVCATNKITYNSVCHMMKATCEAEIVTTVEVEFSGKPCPGKGIPLAGPWSDWGPCSEDCKQGTRNRTREVYYKDEYTEIHDIEFIPCYNTCENGPCQMDTCTVPGQVCIADEMNIPSCQCPICEDFTYNPICGRVGIYIKTYENECELQKDICEKKTDDYEVLEPRACEEKPVKCGLVRNYRLEKDENGCQADRSINFGLCYGGCDDDAELCCYGNKVEQRSAIMYCKDGTSSTKFFDVIVGCDCVTKDQVGAPKMQEVQP